MSRVRGSITTLGSRARSLSQRVAQSALLREAKAVVDAERARWPRKTGRSAAELDALIRGGGVRVVGDAPYTTAIESKGRRHWDELVAHLRRRMATQTPGEVGRDLLRALRSR